MLVYGYVKGIIPPISLDLQGTFELFRHGPRERGRAQIGSKELRTMITRKFKLLAAGLLVAGLPVLAQDSQKTLTNADVVKMVKGGLPESVVVSAIQSSPAKYDISPDALIALQKDGVTAKEMDAIIAESKKAPGAAAGAGNATAAVSEKSHMPRVTVNAGKTSEPLAIEKTELAQTKTKPSSMSSLAGDSTLNQAMRAGIDTAAWNTATHVNSGVASSSVYEGGSVLSSVMARRKPMMTYVWGVPNIVSKTVLQTTSPSFTVDFANVMGANPDDFAPTIVKLTPAQNSFRIVGATQGKEDATSNSTADWEIYSSFLEDRVPVNAQKLKTGSYKLAATSPLAPGEYAVVLRPVSKSKKFSGGDVARGQGDGLMFDSAFSFKIADTAE
jgi:hypothetical protein